VQSVEANAPQLAPDEDFAPNTGNDAEQPPETNLETGLPLNYLLTPFHWGPISLLSVTTYQGYNSNPDFQSEPVGAWITSISGLVLYSTHFSGWRMNLQYEPFIWISSTRKIEDFAAAAADIRTLRHISESWHWTLGDRFRYSPTHSVAQGTGFVANPGGGFTIGNAFLSSGRNVLVNGIAATLTDRYNENSTLTFHADQDYTYVSSLLGTQSTGSSPAQEAITFAAGATWRDHLSLKDTISAEYTYRWLTSSGTSLADVSSQSAGLAWSHKFAPTLGVTASAGPAWSIYGGQGGPNSSSGVRTTVHGSLALSKEFRRGGLVLSFARSDSFSGIISNSFHNRYDLSMRRQFGTRFSCSVTGSYIQQEVYNARNTNGELATAEGRYSLSRNWALFGQVRYLDITGNEPQVAPEKSAIIGFRWFWVPDKE